jgi:hypothetical protein
MNRARERLAQVMADRYGHGGFADTTDADHADKSGSDQMVRYAQNVLTASDHVY